MKKRNLFWEVFLVIGISVLLLGCDTKRNELIRGFFYTETPIPPTPTVTITPTLSPTSIPTPLPEYRIDQADKYLLVGDYDNAISEYEKVLSSNPEEPYYAASVLGKARSYYFKRDYESCQNTLIDGLNTIKENSNKPDLWFQMADCVRELDLYEEEINALNEFLKLRPDTQMRSEIYERIGDSYYSLKSYKKSQNAYLSAVEGTDIGESSWIWMKIADTYSIQEDYTNALKTWLDLYDLSTDDTQKARIDSLLADVYLKLDSPEQAYARYQDAVNNFPRTYDSYLALLTLLNSDQTVNEYQRGLINYYQGQYALSSEAFHRYIESNPAHNGSAYYYIGLNQMFLGDYQSAVETFATLIENYPDNQFYASAWDEKSYVEWYYLENFAQGAQTLIDFVKLHPDYPEAPGFIYEAGRIFERGDRLTQAATQWERLIDEYPLYENSIDALFLSGICRYRTKNYDAALSTFNRLLLVSTQPADIARAHFWIAKVYDKKGESGSAKQNYESAAQDSPTDYYTERAKEILAGKKPLSFSENYNLTTNLSQAQVIAEQWMRLTFSIPDEVVLDQPDALLLDSDYLHADELWELGHYQDAIAMFDAVRLKYENDPVNSFRLLNRLVSLGAWRPAVYTSRQILTSAGLLEDARTLEAPNYFNWIRYGTWFNEIVQEVFDQYKIHPFILYGLMRQESMYDPWISSSAGASGLMQIMPATGLELSKKLQWPPNYADSDLLRAMVAINFSADYLSTQHDYFGNDNFYMLASYNAGPGSTSGWVDKAENDPDLFLEIIRFEETRTYIRNVYEYAKMYERFYGVG